jgi:hypothetical protein
MSNKRIIDLRPGDETFRVIPNDRTERLTITEVSRTEIRCGILRFDRMTGWEIGEDGVLDFRHIKSSLTVP